jgi:hypothetical protein
MHETERAMRQVLAELELTSTTAARAFVAAVTGTPPSSSIPTGSPSPAEHWRDAYNRAGTDSERDSALRGARDELAHIRRRRFQIGVVRDGDDLRARVLSDGESATPEVVAMALRCTPTFVRRVRLAAGRDVDRGRALRLELEPRALRGAGMSIRAIALATGVARSTLHDQLTNQRQEPPDDERHDRPRHM